MENLLEELEGLDHGSCAGKQHLEVVLHHRWSTNTKVTSATCSMVSLGLDHRTSEETHGMLDRCNVAEGGKMLE